MRRILNLFLFVAVIVMSGVAMWSFASNQLDTITQAQISGNGFIIIAPPQWSQKDMLETVARQNRVLKHSMYALEEAEIDITVYFPTSTAPRVAGVSSNELLTEIKQDAGRQLTQAQKRKINEYDANEMVYKTRTHTVKVVDIETPENLYRFEFYAESQLYPTLVQGFEQLLLDTRIFR